MNSDDLDAPIARLQEYTTQPQLRPVPRKGLMLISCACGRERRKRWRRRLKNLLS
jgi:hypothetical protein